MPQNAPAPNAPPSAGPRPLGAALSLAAVALSALACFRATVTFDPFPYFSTDPFQSLAPTTSLTPAAALWLDAASLLLATTCLVLHRASGQRLRRPLVLLGVLAGIIPLLWSIGVRPGPAIDQMRLAFSTLVAFWTAIALAHACADPRRRALCLAVLLGVALMMVAKGLVQVLVEHPDTLAWYRRDPDAFLRAQGWEPGSAQARAYERRLRQPEATGWFGLSNILATVMAAGAVGLGTIAASGIVPSFQRRPARPPHPTRSPGLETSRRPPLAALGLALAAVLCTLGLLLTHSKGGMAAAVGGAAAVTIVLLVRAWLARRDANATGAPRPLPAWAAPALAAALVVLPLIGVVARGLIGERIGELSILFRWFYMKGAARIIADHPLAGVGPAGFRDAYVLVKPPLAVEDVTSPHCFPLDLLTGYGVPAGAAMLAIIILLAASAIRAVLLAPPNQHDATPPPNPGADTKALALLLILATMAAALIERPLLTPEIALSRLAGLALWIAAAGCVLWMARHAPRALTHGASATVAVLVLHAGIEMTPIWPNAQAWFLALLGAAGAAPSLVGPPARTSEPRRAARAWPALAALTLWTTLCLLAAPWSILEWQGLLKQAATAAAPVGQLRTDMGLLSSDPRLAQALGISPESIRADLGRLVNQPPAPTPEQFERQLTALVQSAATEADVPLQQAIHFDHLDTLRAMGRTVQHRISALVEMGRPDFALAILTDTIARTAFAVSRLDNALAWSHLASLNTLRADLLDQIGRAEDARAARALAIDHYTRAAERDPRGVFHPVRLARLAASIDDPDGARRWARQALENHSDARLDPVMGLSETELAEMERLARPAATDDPPPP